MSTQDALPPLTANMMAVRLGRSPIGVYTYLRRHGIKPSLVLPGRNYYAPETLEILRQGMRARTGTRAKTRCDATA